MVPDAKDHEAEDKKRREEVEQRNRAEQLVYQMEKLVKENKEKLGEAVAKEVEQAVEEVHRVREKGTPEEVKAAMERLEKACSPGGQGALQVRARRRAAPGGRGSPQDRGGAQGQRGRCGVQAGLARARGRPSRPAFKGPAPAPLWARRPPSLFGEGGLTIPAAWTSPSPLAPPSSTPPAASPRQRGPWVRACASSTRWRWSSAWASAPRRPTFGGAGCPGPTWSFPASACRSTSTASRWGRSQLELLGVPVLNGAYGIAASRNKMRALQMLSAAGIPVPRTLWRATPRA